MFCKVTLVFEKKQGCQRSSVPTLDIFEERWIPPIEHEKCDFATPCATMWSQMALLVPYVAQRQGPGWSRLVSVRIARRGNSVVSMCASVASRCAHGMPTIYTRRSVPVELRFRGSQWVSQWIALHTQVHQLEGLFRLATSCADLRGVRFCALGFPQPRMCDRNVVMSRCACLLAALLSASLRFTCVRSGLAPLTSARAGELAYCPRQQDYIINSWRDRNQ